MEKFFYISVFLVLLFSTVNSQFVDSCNSNLSVNVVQLPFDASSFNCNPVWASQGFILRYQQTAPSQWSFVLSAPSSNAYVAMGFSPNGKMVGSSAIVGWVGTNNVPIMKRYFLGGQSSGQVLPDQGNLHFGNESSIVTSSTRIYMSFQLNVAMPETKLIYSIGPPNEIPSSPGFRLSEHVNQVSTVLNYATGQSQTKSSTVKSLRRSHGILNMLGWAILMPIGAIVARFMKQYDPIWFYSHTSIQSLGFVLGIAGIICGFVLKDRVSTNVSKHKAIGIVVLVLACLQVMAFLARPNKESKVRKYWNWYHYTVGRVLIFLAAVNVFYGIHLGNGGTAWNAAYAIVLVLLVAVAVLLQLRMMTRK